MQEEKLAVAEVRLNAGCIRRKRSERMKTKIVRRANVRLLSGLGTDSTKGEP